jgi:hypothetical protein
VEAITQKSADLLTNVHEDAHLRNSLKFGRAGLPHKSRKRGHRQEVFGVRCRDVECGDSAIGWSGDMKLVILDLAILPGVQTWRAMPKVSPYCSRKSIRV